MNGYDKLKSDVEKILDTLKEGGCCPIHFDLGDESEYDCSQSCKKCWTKAMEKEYE